MANRSRQKITILLGCLAVVFCIIGITIILTTGLLLILNKQEVIGSITDSQNLTGQLLASDPDNGHLPDEPVPLPTFEFSPISPTSHPTISPTAVPISTTVSPTSPTISRLVVEKAMARSNLEALLASDFPPRNYLEAATRLGGVQLANDSSHTELHQLGEIRTFYTDLDEIEAELVAITDHFYFWKETSLELDSSQLLLPALRFDKEYLPKINKLFSVHDQEGIDNDPKVSILHMDGYADNSELGFFNSGDQYPKIVNPRSNEEELIYLNMKNLELGEDLYFGTIAHEYQHLIHWQTDPNETIWLSEGLAQLSEVAIGLRTADSIFDYWSDPGIQLNDWNYENEGELLAHYGAAYLFLVYIWEKLGDEAIRDIYQDPANGMASIAKVLQIYQPDMTLNEFVGNWAVANYLDDQTFGENYGYDHLELANPENIEILNAYPVEIDKRINQFASDYIKLDASSPLSLTFNGSDDLNLLQNDFETAESFWFSPAMNELDATLTTSINLANTKSPSLGFKIWYDLEAEYDFAYISISVDEGETWKLLRSEHAINGEFGPAFGGKSIDYSDHIDGWLQEEISLQEYIGEKVKIRFETLTDSAETGSGVAISGIILHDAEGDLSLIQGTASWENKGFVYMGSTLPQLWQLQLVEQGVKGKITQLPLNDQNEGQWQMILGDEGGTLVVTALTPYSFMPAYYNLKIDQLGSP